MSSLTVAAVSKLKKAEAKRQLEMRTGEEISDDLSAQEIRDQLKDIIKAEMQPKNNILLNMSKDKKHVLQEKAKTLGLEFTDNVTRPKLMTLIRDAVFLQSTPAGKDTMKFGKHANWSYLRVVHRDAQYAKWCSEVYDTEECNPKMKRFVNWLRTTPKEQLEAYDDDTDDDEDGSKSPAPSRQSKSSASTSVRRTTSRRRTRSPGTGGGSDKESTIMEMLTAMQKQMAEMKQDMDRIKKEPKDEPKGKNKGTDSAAEDSSWSMK